MTRDCPQETAPRGTGILTAQGEDRAAGCNENGPETAHETTLETVSGGNLPSVLPSAAIPAPRQTTPPFRRRLPRFVRAKRSWRPHIVLQDRDLLLLQSAHEYRLITTPQFFQLFSGESRDGLYRRLQKLFHHGYLDRIGSNPNAPLVYALGRSGAETLAVSRRKEVRAPYIAHQLMIGDFRIALTLATRERGIVLSWRAVPRGLPVRPDGFFGLQFPDRPEGRNRAFFFLEADRSTMPRDRFVGKLAAYWAWCSAGGPTAALGIRSFRILTLTKSGERLASLLQAVESAEQLRAGLAVFWFSTATRIASGELRSAFEAIWEIPGRRGRRASIHPDFADRE